MGPTNTPPFVRPWVLSRTRKIRHLASRNSWHVGFRFPEILGSLLWTLSNGRTPQAVSPGMLQVEAHGIRTRSAAPPWGDPPCCLFLCVLRPTVSPATLHVETHGIRAWYAAAPRGDHPKSMLCFSVYSAPSTDSPCRDTQNSLVICGCAPGGGMPKAAKRKARWRNGAAAHLDARTGLTMTSLHRSLAANS
jgi:hypothetical protein